MTYIVLQRAVSVVDAALITQKLPGILDLLDSAYVLESFDTRVLGKSAQGRSLLP